MKYKGYVITTKDAFSGFYATAENTKDEDLNLLIQPAGTDQQIPASDAHGFDTEAQAVTEAKRKISLLLNRLP